MGHRRGCCATGTLSRGPLARRRKEYRCLPTVLLRRLGERGRGNNPWQESWDLAKTHASRSKDDGVKPVATNRKAFHEYFIQDRTEAGLVLTGTEVKSLRDGRAQLKDSYVQFRSGEAFLIGAHISAYHAGSWSNHLPERERKLLLHRREIDKWAGAVATRGVACVPLSLYFRGPMAKAEIALVRGKKLHDKRDAIRDRDLRREADRDMRERSR